MDTRKWIDKYSVDCRLKYSSSSAQNNNKMKKDYLIISDFSASEINGMPNSIAAHKNVKIQAKSMLVLNEFDVIQFSNGAYAVIENVNREENTVDIISAVGEGLPAIAPGDRITIYFTIDKE